MFGRRSEEVKGEWRKPHELNVLFSSPDIVRVIKLRRVRWALHVVRMGERKGVYMVLLGKREAK